MNGTQRSVIDGNFALNAKEYEHQDLKDINKETSFGFNFTVYPHATYTMRDQNSNKIYTDGHTLNKVGTTVATQFDLTYIDQSRNVLATIGSGVATNFDTTGVNRDVENNISKWSGIKVEGISINPGTEFWLTEAGRGTYLDQYDDAKRAVKAVSNIVSSKDSLVEAIKTEQTKVMLEKRGFMDWTGKTKLELQEEVNARYGDMIPGDIILFSKADLAAMGYSQAEIDNFIAKEFAVRSDGSVWVFIDAAQGDRRNICLYVYMQEYRKNVLQRIYYLSNYMLFLRSEIIKRPQIT